MKNFLKIFSNLFASAFFRISRNFSENLLKILINFIKIELIL